MWQILDPAQVKKIQDWQSQTQVQANGLISSGKTALSEAKYVGVPAGVLRNGIDSLTAWSDLVRGSVTSKDNLLKALSPAP